MKARQEEIQKLIDEEMGIDDYGSCDFQVGVCYAVRYADKTMIEKVEQWLINSGRGQMIGSFHRFLEKE